MVECGEGNNKMVQLHHIHGRGSERDQESHGDLAFPSQPSSASAARQQHIALRQRRQPGSDD